MHSIFRRHRPAFWLRLLLAGLAERIDLQVAFIVFCSVAFTTLTWTTGIVIIALRGEAWWTVGGLVSLVVQVAISFGAVSHVGRLAIPIAMVGQSIALNMIMVYGALMMWRTRMRSMPGSAGTCSRSPNPLTGSSSTV